LRKGGRDSGVSVCDIAGKVANQNAVLDGIVDEAELLSNSYLGEERVSPVDLLGGWNLDGELGGVGGSIETKLVGDSGDGFWTSCDEKSVARVAAMTVVLAATGRRRICILIVS